MKTKILGILVCTLLIATVLPVGGTINENSIFEEQQNFTDVGNNGQTGSEDWWPMHRHDPGNTGCSSSIAPNTNHLLWQNDAGENIGVGSPIIVEDKLYISIGGYYAIDPPIIPNSQTPSIQDKSRLLSTIFEPRNAPKEDNSGGLLCLDAVTGTPLWEFPITEPNDPVVVDGKAYVTSFDMYSYDSLIYCLDAETGANIWQKPVGGLALSPTIVADDKGYVGALDYYSLSGTLSCFDTETGTTLWTYYLPPYEFMYFSAPAVVNDKVYFTTMSYATYSGNLYCLDAETGGYLWAQPLGYSLFASPVVADGKVYAVGLNIYSYFGYLYCFDAVAGSPLWTFNMGANQYSLSTPAFCDDSIYITTLNRYSYTSGIYCIDAESGDMTWHVPLSGHTFYTSPAVADDKIYISTEEGVLYCLDTTHGGLVWSYQLDHETGCSPAIADERLYIADYYGNIYAFEDELKIAKLAGGFLNVKALSLMMVTLVFLMSTGVLPWLVACSVI